MMSFDVFGVDRLLGSAWSIVLAAGKGSRMQSRRVPKACRTIEGVPAVRRLIDSLRAAGVRNHVVVEPAEPRLLRRALEPLPVGLRFASQPEPLGTGDAARCGVSGLPRNIGSGPVLVVAGDKVLEPASIRRLAGTFLRENPALAFITGPRDAFPDAGVVVPDPDGAPCRIVEVADLGYGAFLRDLAGADWQGTILGPARADALARRYVKSAEKRAVWVHRIMERVGTMPADPGAVRADLRQAGEDLPSLDTVAHPQANLSVYLFDAKALRWTIERLERGNAQAEFYLTDAVAVLRSRGARVVSAPVNAPEEVMAFNTPDELQRVRQAVRVAGRSAGDRHRRTPLGRARFATIRPWTAAPGLSDIARGAIEGFAEAYGGRRPVALVRAPGRVNLMGRHVDHQGGVVNPIALDREVAVAFRARADDKVSIRHHDARRHAAVGFRIPDTLNRLGAGTWRDAVNSPQLPPAAPPHTNRAWARYAEAAAARVQTAYPDTALTGFDALVHADLPQGYGLASSSALTVGFVHACLASNGIDPDPREIARLTGEAEWYVGTRGGFADQAAMMLARPGRILSMLEGGDEVCPPSPFPPGTALFLALSGQPALKGADAQAVFNARVAAYAMACSWLAADGGPARGAEPSRLADFGAPVGSVPGLLRRLARMPSSVTEAAFRPTLSRTPWLADRVGQLWAAQADTGIRYRIRDTALYGFAEMARAARFTGTILRDGVEAAGQTMFRSHDGDRVCRWVNGVVRPWRPPTSPSALQRVACRCETARDPVSVLARQTGAYRCSTPRIDRIVDAVAAVPGVLGAQICGAGLGGAAMVWCRSEALAEARRVARSVGATPIDAHPAGPAGFVLPPSG